MSKLWHTAVMRINFDTYSPGSSLVHTCDTRVKIVLLLAYSITLFFVQTWAGLLICVAVCLATALIARVSLRRLAALLIPLYVVLFFTLLFNGFSFDVTQAAPVSGVGDVSAGLLASAAPIPLIGDFGFVPAGFARGCFYALRIVMLVLASLVVSFTSTSTELTNAFADFLKPLRHLKVPVDDIAMMVSLALRFIPLTAEELGRIYAAQKSRGAAFDSGGVFGRLKAWQPVLVPLFVSLFRRADQVAVAMEARCYALTPDRSRLHRQVFTTASALVLVFGCAFFACLGYLL